MVHLGAPSRVRTARTQLPAVGEQSCCVNSRTASLAATPRLRPPCRARAASDRPDPFAGDRARLAAGEDPHIQRRCAEMCRRAQHRSPVMCGSVVSVAECYVRRGRDVLGLFANVGQLSLVVDGFGSGSWGARSTRALFLSRRRASQDGVSGSCARSPRRTRICVGCPTGLRCAPSPSRTDRPAHARAVRVRSSPVDCTIAGFYRYAEEEGLIGHSAAIDVQRRRLD
jgi:hypothetical protein